MLLAGARCLAAAALRGPRTTALATPSARLFSADATGGIYTAAAGGKPDNGEPGAPSGGPQSAKPSQHPSKPASSGSNNPQAQSLDASAPTRGPSIDASASGTHTQGAGQMPDMPRLVIFGGRGFVGSHICQEALNVGLQVVSVSPSGTPPPVRESWVHNVTWARGNALEPRTYVHQLEGVTAVISCVGGFGSQEEMQRINGEANVSIIEAAKVAGVPRFVYISANIPSVPGLDMVLGGYIRGKQMAEDALFRNYPDTGVALRPGVIYGSRAVSNTLTLPLQYVFGPVAAVLQRVPSRQLASVPLVGAAFVPPADVKQLARAAVRAATDDSFPPGVLDPWDIQQQ